MRTGVTLTASTASGHASRVHGGQDARGKGMDIGFCGLGLIGTPMTARLLAHGHRVAVWTRTREKAAAWAARCNRAMKSW